MEIKFFCPIWGMVPDYIERIDVPLHEVLGRIKSAGYDGVEMAIPRDVAQQRQLLELLPEYGLNLVALQWASAGSNITDYLKSFEAFILSAAGVKPLYITSHTGKDYFSFEENCRVIDMANLLEKKTGIPIIHEIHRSRFTFHAYGLQQYLKTYPDLKLAADFSHWCTVSESFLQDQSENVNNAVKRAIHIHARVGYPQGPQVNDPRAPEWTQALNVHLEWWDAIVDHCNKEGAAELVFTPEFGSGNYMPRVPFTNEPLADQWEINLWMMEKLKERYASR